MPRVTVERDGIFIHCSQSQLGGVLVELGGVPVKGGESVLTAAMLAANAALNQLSVLVPIHGPASKNLGTALRVREIRAALGCVTLSSGGVLLEELQYIAKAADAA